MHTRINFYHAKSHPYDHCIEKRGDVGIAPYGWDGFVTIYTLHWRETQGRIVGGDALIAPPVLLSEIGRITVKFYHKQGAVLSAIDEYAYYNKPQY